MGNFFEANATNLDPVTIDVDPIIFEIILKGIEFNFHNLRTVNMSVYGVQLLQLVDYLCLDAFSSFLNTQYMRKMWFNI